jgi:opacity protein-like surface antigen
MRSGCDEVKRFSAGIVEPDRSKARPTEATMRHLIPLLSLTVAAAAVEPPPVQPDGWSHEGRLAALLSDVSTSHADTSRDATIAGTSEAFSWKLSGTGRLLWKGGPNEVQQDLKLEYGRRKEDNRPWEESADEIRYDGVYRRVLAEPHFVYTGWGLETVFNGPEPKRDPLDPGRYWGNAGYGQRHQNVLFADQDRVEGRVGVRAQQRWGDALTDTEKEWEIGPDWFGRYEATLAQIAVAGAETGAIKGFVQYEGWSEFDDLGHTSHLLTLGVFVQFSKYLTLDINYRGYYEAQPDDAAPGAIGYDEWSARREVLAGVTYLF